MIGPFLILGAIAAVVALGLATIGRVHDWSPLGLVVSGMILGAALAVCSVAAYLYATEPDDATD